MVQQRRAWTEKTNLRKHILYFPPTQCVILGKFHIFSIPPIPKCNNITTLAACHSETEGKVGIQINQLGRFAQMDRDLT